MNSTEFLRLIVEDIHTVVMATSDDNGNPVTCVIDMMLYENGKLYFLTAKGKNFYQRLIYNNNIAFSGIKGEDTMSSKSVSFVGKAKDIGSKKLYDLFKKNDYMYDIYPTENSRKALTVFEIYEGSGEFFNLSQKPIFREQFGINVHNYVESGYKITNNCVECGKCVSACPTSCITKGSPYVIHNQNCLRCGNCMDICPHNAVIKL